MARYVFDPPAQSAIPVVGEDALFPVRRILCVGRNYAAHRAEMGGADDPDPPFFFAKPADYVKATQTLFRSAEQPSAVWLPVAQ